MQYRGVKPRAPDRTRSNSALNQRPGGSASIRARKDDGGSPPAQMGLPEMFARGLLERGESLGINRTVMNAVSELRVSSYYGLLKHFVSANLNIPEKST